MALLLTAEYKVLIYSYYCTWFILHGLLHFKNELTVVMSLNDDAEIIYRNHQFISGELLPQSQDLFLAYTLSVKQTLESKPIRITVFKDQIDQVANRRLNRILKQTRFMASK